jgi:hypothetical protein
MHAVDSLRSATRSAVASSHAELQASHVLLVEAEAQTASAARLLVQRLSVAPLHLLVDVHTAGGSRHIPITVDTHRWGQETYVHHVSPAAYKMLTDCTSCSDARCFKASSNSGNTCCITALR